MYGAGHAQTHPIASRCGRPCAPSVATGAREEKPYQNHELREVHTDHLAQTTLLRLVSSGVLLRAILSLTGVRLNKRYPEYTLSFYPGRKTLQLMFILRHWKKAAKAKK